MKYRALCRMTFETNPRPATQPAFPDLRHESLSDAEYEYQELLAEEDFSLERFKYSLTLTMLLWVVLFAAWGMTRLSF